MDEETINDNLVASVEKVAIRHVLCPIDFSDGSQRAWNYGVLLARTFGAKATLLHVFEEPTFAPPGEDPPLATTTSKRRRAEVALELEHHAQRASADGSVALDTRLLFVQDSTVVQAIIESAEQLGSSIIVMGTHGLSGFKRLLFGSVTEGVLRGAHVPVLAVPLVGR